jgi:hypothetical protein
MFQRIHIIQIPSLGIVDDILRNSFILIIIPDNMFIKIPLPYLFLGGFAHDINMFGGYRFECPDQPTHGFTAVWGTGSGIAR